MPGSGEAIATALAQRGDTAWVQLLSGDTEVLCALREHGPGRTEFLLTRTPYAELATATGWSETRVRRRMDQLRAAGMLYFKLELDLPSFDFRNATWLWLSVPPSYLAETGAGLAKFPEVAHAIATTGPANLAACAVCRDGESLYQFLTAKVGGLPGVEQLETSPIIRTVKQASPVMLPGPVAR